MGRRRPAAHAVDLLVYAPLGMLLEAPRLLPRFVERGRQQVGSLRRTLGLATPDLDTDDDVVAEALAELPVDRPPVAIEPEPPVPAGPPADTLAIPDYESLSASQVVPRLGGLAADELEAVRAFEMGHRHRSTILNKIAQLQAG
ncbi:MAG: hypothetical protein R2699_06970 [Acidimicrobiales bacterium]|nr:hypothetical protein [Acidimicrobiales bacterium]